MAPVYREVELTWEGRAYKVTPTYALIQRIEQRFSLAGLLGRVHRGDPPLSQLADLIAEMLRAAGCTDASATAENVNCELYNGEGNAEILMTAGMQILTALLPQKVVRGNGRAPAAGATSPTSDGPSTTPSPLGSSGSNPRSSGA